MVGGFGDAFRSGKDEKKKAADDTASGKLAAEVAAQTTREIGAQWAEDYVRPIINIANEELKEHHLQVALEIKTNSVYTQAEIIITSQKPPRAKRIGAVSFTVMEEGKSRCYVDGNTPGDFGSTQTTKSGDVAEFLKRRLKAIGKG